MAATPVSHLVNAYLANVTREAEAKGLPTHRRAELLDELAEHIADARAETGTPDDEATIRTVLDRLGDPAGILDEESLPAAPPPMTPPTVPPTQASTDAGAGSKPSKVPLVVLVGAAGVLTLGCMLGMGGGGGMGAVRPWHIAVMIVVLALIVAAIVAGVRLVAGGRRGR